MTTKYGVRHYTQIGTFLAFKDTTLFGVVIKRSWLSPDGSVLGRNHLWRKAVCLSKEEAIESIRNHLDALNQEHIDEYVYKQEWWEEG